VQYVDLRVDLHRNRDGRLRVGRSVEVSHPALSVCSSADRYGLRGRYVPAAINAKLYPHSAANVHVHDQYVHDGTATSANRLLPMGLLARPLAGTVGNGLLRGGARRRVFQPVLQ
jgi:hypothetical protein